MPLPVASSEYRALMLFEDLASGCFVFPVTDALNAPHLRAGEFAVIDPEDLEPQHGELFLVQWCTGGRALRQIVSRPCQNTELGPFLGWWTRGLASIYVDGPRTTERIREALVGRVVGILAPAHG